MKPSIEGAKPIEILLVNTPDVRAQIALGLKSSFRVRVVNGVQVYGAASSPLGNVRAVVVDVDKDGVALVRDLHLVFPDVRIVAVAKNAAALGKAKRLGAAAELLKPASPQLVTAVVKQVFALP